MKIKTKNIAIVGGSIHSVNKGVEALTYSALYVLDLIAKEDHVNFNFFLLVGEDLRSLYKKENLKIGVADIIIYNLHTFDIFSLKGLIKCCLFPKEIINYFRFDYVFDISGGDSFSDIYGNERFQFINGPKKVFRFLHKKQLLLPQTIGPFKDEKIRKQANRSIEKSKIVLTRDLQSYEYVKSNTKQKQVYELVDVAFFMPYNKKDLDKKYIHVGIGISALLWIGGYTGINQFGLKVDYQETIKEIIKYFLQQKNIKVHLVPHVIRAEIHPENDYEISNHLIEEFDNNSLILSPFFLSPIEAKNYISGLDFFTGARMHACIAAFSSGVPVYPMAYSRKFTGLFGDTLDYKYVGDMVNKGQEDIIIGMKKAFENRHALKSIILDRMNGVVAKRHALMIRLIEDFLEV
jgi:colanic acid/amylovoran biosynthesis protein